MSFGNGTAFQITLHALNNTWNNVADKCVKAYKIMHKNTNYIELLDNLEETSAIQVIWSLGNGS